MVLRVGSNLSWSCWFATRSCCCVLFDNGCLLCSEVACVAFVASTMPLVSFRSGGHFLGTTPRQPPWPGPWSPHAAGLGWCAAKGVGLTPPLHRTFCPSKSAHNPIIARFQCFFPICGPCMAPCSVPHPLDGRSATMTWCQVRHQKMPACSMSLHVYNIPPLLLTPRDASLASLLTTAHHLTNKGMPT